MRLCVICVEDCVQALRTVWPEFRRTMPVTRDPLVRPLTISRSPLITKQVYT